MRSKQLYVHSKSKYKLEISAKNNYDQKKNRLQNIPSRMREFNYQEAECRGSVKLYFRAKKTQRIKLKKSKTCLKMTSFGLRISFDHCMASFGQM